MALCSQAVSESFLSFAYAKDAAAVTSRGQTLALSASRAQYHCFLMDASKSLCSARHPTRICCHFLSDRCLQAAGRGQAAGGDAPGRTGEVFVSVRGAKDKGTGQESADQ